MANTKVQVEFDQRSLHILERIARSLESSNKKPMPLPPRSEVSLVPTNPSKNLQAGQKALEALRAYGYSTDEAERLMRVLHDAGVGFREL